VGKLEVAETSGLNQGLQNIIKNDLLITENTEYSINHHWGIKLPTTWVAEFEVKGHSGKYIDFNFYNENSASNALGYNLTFMDTTMTLRYDGGSALGGGAATIPTIVGAYRKVNIFFERGVISVSIDGTRYLYHKETDGFNQGLGVASRVVSATGSAFVNLFIEQNASNSAFKNLRIVNGRFISDKTSNIAFIGGNLGVGVNSPKESLDIRGNMHLNRVSNVSQISVDSNVVTEYTGPHDRPLRKYPEVALTSASQGGYVVTPSTENATNVAYHMFDGDRSTRWTARGNTIDSYDTSSPYLYNGTNSSSISDTSGTPHDGAFLKLELPTAIRLDYTVIRENSDPASRTPGKITFLGSTNGTDWTFLKEFSGMSNTALDETYVINESNYYNHFAFVVKNLSDGDGTLDLGEWELYGHEEGSGSLDTTLKSVYNVPATTGTQLEVYYDAKGESTVQSPIPDLSPNTNTGAVSGHSPTLDSTDGIDSFKFDASSSQRITSTIDTSYWGTNKLHSVAFWFKADTINGKFNIFHIGNPAASESSGFWISDGSADSNGGNSLNWWFYGGDSTLKTSSFSWALDTWYHIALTFDGSTKKLYVNGKHIDYSVGNVITTLPTGIPASASLAVGSTTNSGDYFDGSIANFRVYGAKVLNTGQVQELYDYQKDYFLGSKSQVTLYKGHLGVGVTEPSGQLELAGDERIQEYPPGPMDGYETLIPGHGVFCAYASSGYTNGSTQNRFAYNAFDKASGSGGLNDIWQSVDGLYNGGSGTNQPYTGSVRLAENLPKGHYLGLKMPYPVKITSFVMGAYFNSGYRAVGDGLIVGRNTNNPTWEVVHTLTNSFMAGVNGFNIATNAPAILITTPSIPIDNTKYYDEYALVINGTLGGSTVTVSEWQLFGTPGPTTLDKGSLTLGRSLDVPRISRYDVDTETPRPEKLVLDYDTTVKNDGRALDISGSGNDGFYYGHAYYSAPDKAFKFDGTGDTVYVDTNGNISDTNLPTGDAIYTMSCWIKANSAQYGSDAAVFYFGSGWTSYQLAGIYHGINGRINMDIGSYNMKTATGTIQSNRWYHVAIVKRGTGTLTSARSYGSIYIDGVEIDPANLTYNAGGPQALQSIDNISIGSNFNGVPGSFGEAFNGCISKPQIWNVALENSEINKLYRLGRTGRSMVISDTAVGIGKVPEAHLDVRGSLNVTGNFNGNSPLKFYRFRLNLPLNNTGTSYIRRNDGAAGFPSDYDDTKIISISSVVYNHNGDVVIGQGEDTPWKHSIYSIPLHSGSSNAGLVIYQKGANVQSSSGGDRRLEILVVTY
jgi:hypothetical protein